MGRDCGPSVGEGTTLGSPLKEAQGPSRAPSPLRLSLMTSQGSAAPTWRPERHGLSGSGFVSRTTAPEAVDRRVRWQELIRGEHGEISPHASPRTRGKDVNSGFDRQEYPGLAAAADAWDEIRSNRYKRWRLRRRSKRY